MASSWRILKLEEASELPRDSSCYQWGAKVTESFVNSEQSLLSSCSHSETVLLRDTSISSILQLLETAPCQNWEFCRDGHIHLGTAKTYPDIDRYIESFHKWKDKKPEIPFTSLIGTCPFMHIYKDTDMRGRKVITDIRTDVCRHTPTCFTLISNNTQI